MSNLLPRNPSRFIKSLFLSQLPNWEELEKQFESDTGVSVYEDGPNVIVEAQMPGLKPNDIHVTVEDGLLRIDGEREEKEDNKERKYHRKASYSFSYRLTLPNYVDENSPKAVYKDGIMQLTFKKSKEGKAKRINVQGG